VSSTGEAPAGGGYGTTGSGGTNDGDGEVEAGDAPLLLPRRKPFRFCLQTAGPLDQRGWRETARKAEDLGYAVLTVADHLDSGPAPVPALMAAADATTTLRIGSMVFANDYKHPVVLAKEAATLDVLSGGRFELGLGAGWMTSDYVHAGIPMDPPGVRIARLEEAIAVIKGLMSEGPFDFEGTHYRVSALDGLPKPLQQPHPPVVIGGGGRRVLELAAREADIVGLNIALWAGRIDESAGPSATREATAQKLRWLRAAAPSRYEALEVQVRVHLAMVTDDRDGVADAVGPALGLTPQQAKDSPHALVGTVDHVVEQCHFWRDEFGISTFGLSADVVDDFAPVVARLAGT
jgi:probable F420-dependent oxidoreductase